MDPTLDWSPRCDWAFPGRLLAAAQEKQASHRRRNEASMNEQDVGAPVPWLCSSSAARVHMPLGARWSLNRGFQQGGVLSLTLVGTVDVFARRLSNDQGPRA